jgi:hypothetical protein
MKNQPILDNKFFQMTTTIINAVFINSDCVFRFGEFSSIYCGNNTVMKALYVYTSDGYFRINPDGRTGVELAVLVSVKKGFGSKVMSILCNIQDMLAKQGQLFTLTLGATPSLDFNPKYLIDSVKSKVWFSNYPQSYIMFNTPLQKLVSFYSKFGFSKTKLDKYTSGKHTQYMKRSPKPHMAPDSIVF